MISRIIFKDTIKSLTPELSAGIVSLIMVSCTSFTIGTRLSLSEDIFSLGTSVFVNGHVHKLLTYSFHHKTMVQMILSVGVLVPLCGNVEKSLGTVRFLFLFALLSVSTGLLYVVVVTFLDASLQRPVGGFVPVSLAFIGVTTMHTRMTKAYLFGVNVPILALPWLLLLIVTLLVPHAVLLCNVLAILTGWTYGKGWFSLLDMSEARASVLDKKLPFRLLKSCGLLYVPAALEERRKTLHPRITPTPGSYPVQAYAPVSPSNMPAAETAPKMYEGWAHSTYTQASPQTPSGLHGHGHSHGLAQSFGLNHGHSHEHGHGHSCNHSHGHGHGPGQGHGEHMWGNNIPNSHSQHSHSQHSHLSPSMDMFNARPAVDLQRPAVSPGLPVSLADSTSVMVNLEAHGGPYT